MTGRPRASSSDCSVSRSRRMCVAPARCPAACSSSPRTSTACAPPEISSAAVWAGTAVPCSVVSVSAIRLQGSRRAYAEPMKLEGIHHITAITGDAPRNVDFYARVLGLRLVKKTVNQDDPTVYHLFYGDEQGDPGLDLTFFEYPGVAPGRPGAGMVHRIVWRVASAEAIDFWESRLSTEGVDVRRHDERLRFSDPEGLDHELRVDNSGDEPLTADHIEVPPEHALQGFDGVRVSLPPAFEHLRDRVEKTLTPLPDVTQWRPAKVRE